MPGWSSTQGSAGKQQHSQLRAYPALPGWLTRCLALRQAMGTGLLYLYDANSGVLHSKYFKMSIHLINVQTVKHDHTQRMMRSMAVIWLTVYLITFDCEIIILQLYTYKVLCFIFIVKKISIKQTLGRF